MTSPRYALLFVFGTLRDDDVLRIVLGRELPSCCRRFASLADHDLLMLHDETYPVLVPAPGGSVAGAVLTLTDRDMARVAFFEADEYEFEPAQVRDVNEQPMNVLLCAERSTRPGPRYPWSFGQWQRQHKQAFLNHTRTYMAQFGSMSAAQADVIWKSLTGRE